ncbi:hypothetical protein BJ742DRAFT_410470 [Cladochytrium replicatum]|nr:hypothetical protein BJ742DRAFT_410470 [Cladochytrium replicatum]
MIKQNEVAMEPTKKSSEQGDAITNSVDENDSQDLDEPSESTATSTSKTNPLSFLFSMMTKGGATLAKKAHAYEYIVFYVRFLARVTKRLQSKGYDVQMMNVTVPEMKMAVTTDPNGIEVRLMELTDLQLADDPGKTPWFGRLAYYTIPTDYAVETVRRLERLFGTHPPHYHAVARVRKAGGVTSKFPGGNSSNSGASSFNTGFPTTIDQLLALSSTISVATGLRSPPIAFGSTGDPKGGGMYGTKNLFTVGKGFRLVDTEDISVGLSRIVYYWMGNDLRNNACTVCFSQKSDSNSPAATSQQYRSKSKLLAIGFETNNIDQAITLLKYEELPWEEAKLKLKDVGLFARFPDQLNNIHVELFAPVQKEEPAQKGKGAGKLSQKRFGVHYGTEEDEERAMKDEEERHRLRHEAVFEVSTKHLKGHVRSWLSEGVIHEVRTTEESEQLKKRPSSSM